MEKINESEKDITAFQENEQKDNPDTTKNDQENTENTEKKQETEVIDYELLAKNRFEELMQKKYSSLKHPEGEGKENLIVGNFTKWFDQRGFGFIRTREGSVFCHISKMCPHLAPDGQINLQEKVFISKIEKRSDGKLSAEGAICEDCVSPEEYRLMKSNEEISGIPKFIVEKTKGRGHALNPTSKEMEEVNREFTEARRRLIAWNEGLRNWTEAEEFFSEFGEPQEIKVDEDGKKITLVYPEGTKRISTEEAMYIKHWEISPTDEWKQENESILAEFSFKDIPGAKVSKKIAAVEDKIFPRTYDEINLLPKETQEEILSFLRKEIPESPVEFIQETLEEKYKNKGIGKIRDDMVFMQAPGDAILTKQVEKYTEYYTESSDGYLPAGSFQTKGNFYYLTVGVLGKKEDFFGNPANGLKKFSLGRYLKTDISFDDPLAGEKIKENLLQERIEEIDKKVKEIEREIKLNLEISSKRVFDSSFDEWRQLYINETERIIKEAQERWKEEDQEILSQYIKRYEDYQERPIKEIVDNIRKIIDLIGEHPYLNFCLNCGIEEEKASEFLESLEEAIDIAEKNRDVKKAEAIFFEIKEKINNLARKQELALEEILRRKAQEDKEKEKQQKIKESGLPEDIVAAFGGDIEKARTFIRNVDELDYSLIDEHILCGCGRDRRRAHLINISENENFFNGADPNIVWYYIAQKAGLMKEDEIENEENKDGDDDDNKGESADDIIAALNKKFRK
ncbi:MAG: hypothetical protein WC472_01425 [Candidatus Paceibacterota bacterium]